MTFFSLYALEYTRSHCSIIETILIKNFSIMLQLNLDRKEEDTEEAEEYVWPLECARPNVT